MSTEKNKKDNPYKNSNEVAQILRETGSTNVKSVTYSMKLKKWRVKYKNGLPEDRFDLLSDMIDFFNAE